MVEKEYSSLKDLPWNCITLGILIGICLGMLAFALIFVDDFVRLEQEKDWKCDTVNDMLAGNSPKMAVGTFVPTWNCESVVVSENMVVCADFPAPDYALGAIVCGCNPRAFNCAWSVSDDVKPYINKNNSFE